MCLQLPTCMYIIYYNHAADKTHAFMFVLLRRSKSAKSCLWQEFSRRKKKVLYRVGLGITQLLRELVTVVKHGHRHTAHFVVLPVNPPPRLCAACTTRSRMQNRLLKENPAGRSSRSIVRAWHRAIYTIALLIVKILA